MYVVEPIIALCVISQINPSLLVKKDRGRPGGPVAKPKQYGEVNVFSNVPNVELLQESDHESDSDDGDQDDDDMELPGSDDVEQELIPDDAGTEEEGEEDSDDDDMNNTEDDSDVDASIGGDEEEDMNDSDEGETDSENEELESEDDDGEASAEESGSKGKKRKIVDFDANLLSADTSLRALKRFAEAKSEQPSLDDNDGILSNEDFRKIKDLQVRVLRHCLVNKSNVIDVFLCCVAILPGKEGSKTCIGSKGIQGSGF